MNGKRSRRERQAQRSQEQQPTRSGSRRRMLAAVAIVALAAGAAALIAVVAFGGRGKVERSAAPAAAKGTAASPFQTVLASGTVLTGGDLRGRPTVAAFVIEDCTSCVETLQTLSALSKDGVRTIAVNVNVPPGTSPTTAARRLKSFGSDVHASDRILYAADPGQRTAKRFGVRQIESYLLFDKNGREVGHGVALSPRQIRRALNLA